MHVLQFEVCFRSLSSVTKRRAGELATERYSRRLAAMDDRAETQRIEERLPQGTDEWLARPRLSTTSRGTITPVAILQPLSAPVGDVVMYTGPLQPIGWQLHGIGREFGGGTQPADVAVEAGAITQDKRRVDVGPTRASKSRRMDRRLTHWQCIYCRRETRNECTGDEVLELCVVARRSSCEMRMTVMGARRRAVGNVRRSTLADR